MLRFDEIRVTNPCKDHPQAISDSVSHTIIVDAELNSILGISLHVERKNNHSYEYLFEVAELAPNGPARKAGLCKGIYLQALVLSLHLYVVYM